MIAALAAAALSWTTLTPATLQRTEVGAARVGHYAYVLGGFVAPGRTSAAVERYDLRRDRWARVRGLPFGLNHAAVAAYGGRLYVVGGYRARTAVAQESAALLRYDPRTDRWTRLRDMPTARGALAVGVVGGRLYAAGGAAGGQALTTLEIYDFATGRWHRGRDMAVAREHLAGVALSGRFYALAGRTGAGNLTVVERYDPASGRWRRLPDMRKARGGIAAATPAGRIVVVGGEQAARSPRSRPTTPHAGAGARWPTCPRRATASGPWPTAGRSTCSRAVRRRGWRSAPRPSASWCRRRAAPRARWGCRGSRGTGRTAASPAGGAASARRGRARG